MELTYNADIMGNWHHDVQVTDAIRTSDLSGPYDGKKYTNKEHISQLFSKLYGDSLKDKTFLDCACNAGGSLFELQRYGIKSGYGFDVRDLWINQALWLKQNINLYDTSNLAFEQKDFNSFDYSKRYDVTLFNGIFYHLANPVQVLAKIADITDDIIVINTAYSSNCVETRPCLLFKMEGKAMSEGLTGIEGISWLPNGEQMLYKILQALQFKHFNLVFKNTQLSRLCIIASKKTKLGNEPK